MDNYRVELDVYHGPLDLLLYLIRRDEIDIHDIPISHITGQYLQHVRTLRQLDINLAGEFLVMAATLMEVKSAMMSLRHPSEGEEGEETTDITDPEDPRYELVQQLLAYKRFKDAAHMLDHRRASFAARFPLRPAPFEADVSEDEMPALDLEDVSVWNLLEAFTSLMEQINVAQRTHEIIDDDTPIELHAEDIMDRLGRDGTMSLQDMFAGRGTVSEMIGLFLAMLELIRQRKVRASQERTGAVINLELQDESNWMDLEQEDDEAERREVDPSNPDDFDWPDAQAREVYSKRQGRRARGEFILEDKQYADDVAAIEAEEQAQVAPVGSDATEVEPADPETVADGSDVSSPAAS
jgi:segregation and condensation protein A